jgi:hypothetical protein
VGASAVSTAAPWDPAAADYAGPQGKNQAYVQFRQPMPAGFERLGIWPTELFDAIAPPKAGAGEIERKQP